MIIAGYGIIDPEYRAQGVFADMVFLWGAISVMRGYDGALARTLSTGVTVLVTTKQRGTQHIGIIPDSFQMDGDTWVDDLITFNDYSKLQAEKITDVNGLGFSKII